LIHGGELSNGIFEQELEVFMFKKQKSSKLRQKVGFHLRQKNYTLGLAFGPSAKRTYESGLIF
jgi:hypothetical protein